MSVGRQHKTECEASITANCQPCIQFCFNYHFKWRLALASLHYKSGKKETVGFINVLSGILNSRVITVARRFH